MHYCSLTRTKTNLQDLVLDVTVFPLVVPLRTGMPVHAWINIKDYSQRYRLFSKVKIDIVGILTRPVTGTG